MPAASCDSSYSFYIWCGRPQNWIDLLSLQLLRLIWEPRSKILVGCITLSNTRRWVGFAAGGRETVWTTAVGRVQGLTTVPIQRDQSHSPRQEASVYVCSDLDSCRRSLSATRGTRSPFHCRTRSEACPSLRPRWPDSWATWPQRSSYQTRSAHRKHILGSR